MLLLLLFYPQININLQLHKNRTIKGNIKGNIEDNIKDYKKDNIRDIITDNFQDILEDCKECEKKTLRSED